METAQITTRVPVGAARAHAKTDGGVLRQATADSQPFMALLRELLPAEPASGLTVFGPAEAGGETGSSVGAGRKSPGATAGPDENDTVADDEPACSAEAQLAQMLAAAGRVPETGPALAGSGTAGTERETPSESASLEPLPTAGAGGSRADAEEIEAFSGAADPLQPGGAPALRDDAPGTGIIPLPMKDDRPKGGEGDPAREPEQGAGKQGVRQAEKGEPALLQHRRVEGVPGDRQDREIPAAAVPRSPEMTADAAYPGVSRSEQAGTPAPAAMAQQVPAGPASSVPDKPGALSRSDGAGPEPPADIRVTLALAKPSPKKEGESGEEERGEAGRERKSDALAGSAAGAERVFALPEQGRPAPGPAAAGPEHPLRDKILAQVRGGVVHHDGRGNGRMTVRLNPAELGELQVEVRVENHRVNVEVVTGSQTVREALMGNLDALKETLLKQNLSMASFDVSSGGGSPFNKPFGEERGGDRRPPRTPLVQGAGGAPAVAERAGYRWGRAESSMVDLRL